MPVDGADLTLARALMRARCKIGLELVRLVIEDGDEGNMEVTGAKGEANRASLSARMVAVAGSEDMVIEILRDLCHQTWGCMQGFAGGLVHAQQHRTEEDQRILGGLALINDLAKTLPDIAPNDRRRGELDVMATHAIFRPPEVIIRDLQGLLARVHGVIHDIANLEGIDCQCRQNPVMSDG